MKKNVKTAEEKLLISVFKTQDNAKALINNLLETKRIPQEQEIKILLDEELKDIFYQFSVALGISIARLNRLESIGAPDVIIKTEKSILNERIQLVTFYGNQYHKRVFDY